MTSFGWLHLSDLHVGDPKLTHAWHAVEQPVRYDLEKLHDQSGPWDAVFLTGDLTQGGTGEDYEKLSKLLEQLWSHFSSLQQEPPYLLSVPGNHDLVKVKRGPAPLESRVYTQKALQKSTKQRAQIERAFANYQDWDERNLWRPPNYRRGILPGDWSAVIEKKGARLGVVGVNSSFLDLWRRPKSDKYGWWRYLDIHEEQLEGLDSSGSPSIDACHVSILLTHHPTDWFCKEGLASFENFIKPKFALHLHGHMHESKAFESAGYDPTFITHQAPSFFGLRKHRGGLRTHGYMAGRAEVQRGEVSLRLFPRVAVESDKSAVHVVPDYLRYAGAIDDYDHGTTPRSRNHRILLSSQPPPAQKSKADIYAEKRRQSLYMYRDFNFMFDEIESLSRKHPITSLWCCGTVMKQLTSRLLQRVRARTIRFAPEAIVRFVVPDIRRPELMRLLSNMAHGKTGHAGDRREHAHAIEEAVDSISALRSELQNVHVECRVTSHFVGYRIVCVDHGQKRGVVFVKEYSFKDPSSEGTLWGGIYPMYRKKPQSGEAKFDQDIRYNHYVKLFESLFDHGDEHRLRRRPSAR